MTDLEMGKVRANSLNFNPHLFHQVCQNGKLIFVLAIEKACQIISKSDRSDREKL